MDGKLIVLAGGEGSGKSSCMKWLRAQLPKGRFVFTREPGGTDFSEAVRVPLLGKFDNKADGLEQLLLFAAARSNHIRHVIAPNLKRGVHVITDRFLEASFAYQVVAGGVSQEVRQLFHLLHDNLVMHGVAPDLYIVFDLDPDVGLARKRDQDELTLFELEDLDYHTRVRGGLVEFLEGRPHSLVDAAGRKGQVRRRVMELILAETDVHAPL